MNRDTLPVIIERDARASRGLFLQSEGFILDYTAGDVDVARGGIYKGRFDRIICAITSLARKKIGFARNATSANPARASGHG
jgi:hypothetical protein